MCELFAFSSLHPARARYSLEEFRQHGCGTGPHCDGWGLAFYAGATAQLYREEKPAARSEWMAFLLHHKIYSTCAVSHIRKATQGDISLDNTQPFTRELNGSSHIFAHNGNLRDFRTAQNFDHFPPAGQTDSEYAFCRLMELELRQASETGQQGLEMKIARLSSLLKVWSALGPANVIYADGEYLFAFANRRTQADGNIAPPGLHYLLRSANAHLPVEPLSGVELDTYGATAQNPQQPPLPAHTQQKMALFASVPLSADHWQAFQENELIVCKHGEIVAQLTLAV